jgi:cysteine-rich repeat protein
METCPGRITIYLDTVWGHTYALGMSMSAVRVALILGLSVVLARGALATTADDVCAPSDDPCTVNGTIIVEPGSVLDFGSRALVLPGRSGNRLELDTGTGVRTMTILAGSLTIEPGSLIRANGGIVDIQTLGSVIVRASGSTLGRIDVSDPVLPGILDIETTGPDADVIIEGVLTGAGTGTEGGNTSIDISASGATSGGDVVLQGQILAGGGGDAFGGDVSIVASGSVSSTGTIDASGGDGGSLDVVAGTGVNFSASGTAKIKLQGTTAGGDSGDLDLEALEGDVVVAQPILATGADEIDFAGSGGSINLLADQGSVRVIGDLAASGGVPDGDGGDLTITSALDIEQTGAIVAQGRPSYGLGGFIDYEAQRAVTLGPTDVSGVCPECDGGDVDVTGYCDVTVPSGVTIENDGVDGAIRLATGNTMRVAGVLSTMGRVDLVHRDAGTLPDLTGSTITPAPLVMVDGTIPACGCTLGVCGDGVVNCGEACDDGNAVDDATCTAECSREPQCGDGILDTFLGETCDDGNQVDCDGCSRTCHIEECGNGVVECDEECDEGGATPTCQADCKLPPPPGCGDGVLDPGEECDDGNLQDCDVLVPGTPPCSRLCTLQTCGDGVVECDEECDDGNNDPCDGCSPTCHFEVCGNGIVDCGEECDEGAQNGQPGSACLADLCRPGEICQVGGPAACIPCKDDTECNICAGMQCVDGVCTSTGADCDDGNPCTADGCSALTGCTHVLLNGPDVPECDDGDACTIPECDADLGCVQRTLTDFEGVTCHLTTLDGLIADPSVDARAQRILGKYRTKIAAFLSKAAEAEQQQAMGRVRRSLKRARGRFRGMRKRVEKLTGKHITGIDVAGKMAAQIDDATVAIEDLMRAFGFPV